LNAARTRAGGIGALRDPHAGRLEDGVRDRGGNIVDGGSPAPPT